MKRLVVLVAAALSGLAGCGGDPKPLLQEMLLRVDANWSLKPASVDQVGFVYTITLTQGLSASSGPTCDKVQASLQVSALGQTLPLTLDTRGCLASSLTAGPTLQPSTVMVTAELDGETIGLATYDGLTPGAAAALVSPADGMVQAGDEVVISPPAALPTDKPSIGYVFPLEEMPWPGSQIILGDYNRLADGIHLQMPAFSGRAALAVTGSPFMPDATVVCNGFARCAGSASNVLGPVFVTETM